MVAMNTQKQNLLIRLSSDFVDISFKESDIFKWSYKEKTIYFNPLEKYTVFSISLLHELAHATLNHDKYHLDIELLKIEREAWQKTKELCEKYNITFNENFAENNLDTYRNWLHLRSLCPDCKVNGMQLSNLNYRCLACFREWSNNDSRFKRLHKRIKK